jgi:hypothetical protein
MGKRAGTPGAEYAHWDGGKPGSPSSAYHPMFDNATFDRDLDFHIHDHNPERTATTAWRMRELCDGVVDVGTLSGRRYHHHYCPVSMSLPIAHSQPGAAGSSSRPPTPQAGTTTMVIPTGVSLWLDFHLGKSNRGVSSREDGTGGGSSVFSWFKRSRNLIDI